MIPRSILWKRIIGLLIGLVYAIVYGIWTALNTGGGHGNFLWLILFFLTYFFGLFFPIMGFLVVDLRSIMSKSIFGSLLFIHFLGNIWYLTPILYGSPGDATDDFQKTWSRSPELLIVMATMHFLPSIALTAFLIKSIVFDKGQLDADAPLGLGLE